MLVCKNLSCIKQDRTLFEDLSFIIEKGDAVHLIGENGAGKTSLLRIIAGLSEPAAGELQWNGLSCHSITSTFKKDVLYLGHKLALQPNLTAIENLTYWMSLHTDTINCDLYSVLAKFGLTGLEDLPVKMLSAGQQRRVSLSRLMCKSAEFWILDEPFTSLDVAGVKMLNEVLCCHVDDGGMLLLTSHSTLSAELNVRLFELEYRW